MIIFSHGFGVRKDARGLFTAIASALQEPVVMFDYHKYDVATDTLEVTPLDQQVEKLQKIMAETDGPVDLICHSQGCVVASMALTQPVRSVIFLAPATTTNRQHFSDLFVNRPGSSYDPDGVSLFKRTDGSTTKVPAAYWDSLDSVGDVQRLYADIASQTKLTIVTAGADDVVERTLFPELDKVAEIVTVPFANHDFQDQARPKVVQLVIQALSRR